MAERKPRRSHPTSVLNARLPVEFQPKADQPSTPLEPPGPTDRSTDRQSRSDCQSFGRSVGRSSHFDRHFDELVELGLSQDRAWNAVTCFPQDHLEQALAEVKDAVKKGLARHPDRLLFHCLHKRGTSGYDRSHEPSVKAKDAPWTQEDLAEYLRRWGR